MPQDLWHIIFPPILSFRIRFLIIEFEEIIIEPSTYPLCELDFLFLFPPVLLLIGRLILDKGTNGWPSVFRWKKWKTKTSRFPSSSPSISRLILTIIQQVCFVERGSACGSTLICSKPFDYKKWGVVSTYMVHYYQLS